MLVCQGSPKWGLERHYELPQSFSLDRKRVNRGYLAPICKECNKEIWRLRKLENPNVTFEYQSAVRENRRETTRKWQKTEKGLAWKRAAAHRTRARRLQVRRESYDPRDIFERDEGLCRHCGVDLESSRWCIDHLVPLVFDLEPDYHPGDTPVNVALSCFSCNSVKGNRRADWDLLQENLDYYMRRIL
jgi:5-methylcytosine-specific restriction endonuclease McrA